MKVTSGSLLTVLLQLLLYCDTSPESSFNVFRLKQPLEKKYAVFTENERKEMVEETKKMFFHAYDNYMTHAFPLDELNPLDCNGRGPGIMINMIS